MRVVTVAGDIDPATLGTTLVHEHLVADLDTPVDSTEGWLAVGRQRPDAAAARRLYESPLTLDVLGTVGLGAPHRANWQLTEQHAVPEAAAFASVGGGTIVSATLPGQGRDPAALAQLSRATGLHVVMGTGWYHPAWSPELADRTAGHLADRMLSEIDDGVHGVRAGIIGTIAALDPLVPGERTLLYAVARAAAQSGAPISLECAPDIVRQREVLAILASEGVDLSRVALARCDRFALAPESLVPILAMGVFVQFDGLGEIPSVYTEVADHDVALAILDLAGRGYADRLLVSRGVRHRIALRGFGGSGYPFVTEQFVPYLRMLGAADDLVTALTVDNPRRLLTMGGAA